MINSVVLMGRICADPELKQTNTGVSVCTIRVAVERPTSKKETDFIDVVTWRQTAEFVSRYFRKGSMIAVQGSIQTRDFEDRNGNKKKSTEIVADRVSFCGREEKTEEKPDERQPEQLDVSSDNEELQF